MTIRHWAARQRERWPHRRRWVRVRIANGFLHASSAASWVGFTWLEKRLYRFGYNLSLWAFGEKPEKSP